jgi:hypothetical protein
MGKCAAAGPLYLEVADPRSFGRLRVRPRLCDSGLSVKSDTKGGMDKTHKPRRIGDWVSKFFTHQGSDQPPKKLND